MTLLCKPFAKARPRSKRGPGVYMPRSYVEAKKDAVWEMRSNWIGRHTLMCPLRVTVTFSTRTGNMRPDTDNAVGGIFDALQQAGVIGNDKQIKHFCASLIQGEPKIVVCLEALVGGA